MLCVLLLVLFTVVTPERRIDVHQNLAIAEASVFVEVLNRSFYIDIVSDEYLSRSSALGIASVFFDGFRQRFAEFSPSRVLDRHDLDWFPDVSNLFLSHFVFCPYRLTDLQVVFIVLSHPCRGGFLFRGYGVFVRLILGRH
jgi:hypothetical protein